MENDTILNKTLPLSKAFWSSWNMNIKGKLVVYSISLNQTRLHFGTGLLGGAGTNPGAIMSDKLRLD